MVTARQEQFDAEPMPPGGGRRNGVSPPATVVAITRNRVDDLCRTVRQLAHNRDVGQVIVVDNGSTDGTADVVRAQHPEVRLVRPGRNLAAAGRNLGVALADQEVVAFADDDSWWAEGALARAASLLAAHPDIGLLAGRILLGPDQVAEPLNDHLAASPLQGPVGDPGPEVLGSRRAAPWCVAERSSRPGGSSPCSASAARRRCSRCAYATAGGAACTIRSWWRTTGLRLPATRPGAGGPSPATA